MRNITGIITLAAVIVFGVAACKDSGTTYTVTLTQGTGYTLTAKAGSASPVAEGGSFTFTFALETGYNQSAPTVKVNGAAVTLTGGEYTIANITANQTVTVEGVTAPNTYTVTFMDGATKLKEETVAHGGSATAPANPTKTKVYLSKFNGWDKAFTNITADTTVNAKWRAYELGETGPGNGKIFYRLEAGFDFYIGTTDADNATEKRYYLEAAPGGWYEATAPNDPALAWQSANNDIAGTGTVLGTGSKNTAIIHAHTDPTPAATACFDYEEVEIDDWFLPSKDELNLLVAQKATMIDIDQYGNYWSSSQSNVTQAYCQRISDGAHGGNDKNLGRSVRPIRAF